MARLTCANISHVEDISHVPWYNFTRFWYLTGSNNILQITDISYVLPIFHKSLVFHMFCQYFTNHWYFICSVNISQVAGISDVLSIFYKSLIFHMFCQYFTSHWYFTYPLIFHVSACISHVDISHWCLFCLQMFNNFTKLLIGSLIIEGKLHNVQLLGTGPEEAGVE